MATSAFKSTTKRSSVGANKTSSSSNRRSRSLSRAPSPRGRFVSTVRGSDFTEISLDHLDDDNAFPFDLKGERSRSTARRRSGVSTPSSTGSVSQRRGRSVSRPCSTVARNDDGSSNHSRATTDTTASCPSSASGPRRRSASVARYHISDSESEDHSHESHHANEKSFGSWNNRKSSSKKPITLNHQRLLKRSSSQKELSKSCDGYSSHSSALTDEEALDTHSYKNGTERTIRDVHLQKKTGDPTGDGVPTDLYEVMRKELRHAVEDIRTEIEQGIMNANHSVLVDDDSLQSNNSDVLQAVSVIRKNYTTKLEQSEKRKQGLLAEIKAEEQRSRELSKIVKELVPEAKKEKSSFGRKKNDKSWMSKSLIEDAEKYFDDFLSNVEDTTTDISSFDGERSDTSTTKQQQQQHARDLTSEMDGVVLPWLQWETSSCFDASPHLKVPSITQEGDNVYNNNNNNCKPSYFNMDDYLEPGQEEDIIFESWRQHHRITSGTLSLCTRPFLHF